MNGRKIFAWCPDDTDESGAREYTGDVPEEGAERHAEFLHAKGGDPCDRYCIRVRMIIDGRVREWDVLVMVDMTASFRTESAIKVLP